MKNILLQYVLPIIGFTAAVYFFLAPTIVGSLYPEYTIKQSYVDVKACTDTTIQPDSSYFLPQTCASLTNNASLGCVSVTSGYTAPMNATKDQKIVCPVLRPTQIDGQAPNSALPVFRIQEVVYRLGSTAVITVAASLIYIVVRIIIARIIRRKYSQSTVEDR